MNSGKSRKRIPNTDRIKIINFFKTEKNNTVSDLVKVFGYSKACINSLLDEHLKTVK